ncbi:RNA-binding MEX3A [Labeo rohita]|uniref:RNA-binding MEX3A n=1 Tax=Labeo rohita TaxID=84645 RepID=A0A498NQJ0_LABRO|nr:RNA-binding MEX3A [Labeo rohita]
MNSNNSGDKSGKTQHMYVYGGQVVYLDDNEEEQMAVVQSHANIIKEFFYGEQVNVPRHDEYDGSINPIPSSLSHSNVVKLLAEPWLDSQGMWNIPLELISGKTLEKIMFSPQPCMQLTKPVMITIIKGMCEGLTYMHSKNIVHQDLKPDNIMVEYNTYRAVIIDLGLARFQKNGFCFGVEGGNLCYSAPEIFQGKHRDQYSDVWAMGKIIAELLIVPRARLPPTISTIYVFGAMAMPSLLVLAGIMEKNGGYGGDLAGSGFGSEGLLVPPEEEEDDSRALRVALGQLSLLGLGEGEDGAPAGGGGGGGGVQDRSNNNHHNHIPADSGMLQGKNKLCALYESSPTETKGRGCNITECVPVPSSEHVAEIVGRQGCKIKALRAKTNTYIKTPVRGEKPVFLITGRKEDVALARREIISAAEHFSMLRASRNKLGVSFSGSPPAPLPGQTTIQVRVPYRVVGLVVGPKGSTIKRIQQQTCTYIVTPSRDRDPVFEITGSPGNAERAREEIEAHIAFRTGGLHDHNNENDCLGPDSGNGGLESRLQQVWGLQGAPRKPLASSYRQNFSDAMVGSSGGGGGGGGGGIYSKGDFTNHSSGDKPCSYFGSEGTQSWGDPDYPKQVAYYAQQRSKSFGGLPLPLTRLSPGLPEPCGTGNSNAVGSPHAQARRAHSEPTAATAAFTGRLPVPDSPPAVARDCMTCFESKVTAALVPCGHNLFCMECAIRICELNHPECPVCHTLVTQAIRIFS